MIAVKQAMLLLLLAAVGTNARPGPEDCDGLNITLPKTDLHKIFGDWVLVWAVTDHPQSRDQQSNVTSSHVELRLLPDNSTVVLKERNVFVDRLCHNYYINMSTASSSENYILHATAAVEEKDGVFSKYNKSGGVNFYETCSDCLVMVVHINNEGRYLLIYRREGHHQDIEQLKAAHSDHHKLAECLGFPHNKPFMYDGAADFCHKKSSPEVKVEPTVKAEHS